MPGSPDRGFREIRNPRRMLFVTAEGLSRNWAAASSIA